MTTTKSYSKTAVKKNETSEKKSVKPKRYEIFCDFRFALLIEKFLNYSVRMYSKVFFLCALWKPSAKLVTRPERHSPTIPNAPVTKVQLNLAVTE